jgi:mannitol/fructose-specific phosphotransferase system IIA component (Ntr-type)
MYILGNKIRDEMKQCQELTLMDVIKPEIVRIGVFVKDREDAIRIAGEVLVEAGIVEERYINAMIESCNELGPYIVLAPGVAIPHAAPNRGAISIGISIVILKNPVEFGNKENDPVRIVIAFASHDKQKHVKILSQLAVFLKDQNRLQELAKASCPEKVVKILAG